VAGDSVNVVLADDIDLSRGDLLAGPGDPPLLARTLEARICWLPSDPLDARALAAARLVLKHTSRSVKARLTAIVSTIDVGTLAEQPAPAGLIMNDIADVTLALAQPIFVDPFRTHRATGSFILIDEVSNQTLAAGMIV
jgi:sulfate adenylyltransferase subunit 1 (EFTu-like GTPase family)